MLGRSCFTPRNAKLVLSLALSPLLILLSSGLLYSDAGTSILLAPAALGLHLHSSKSRWKKCSRINYLDEWGGAWCLGRAWVSLIPWGRGVVTLWEWEGGVGGLVTQELFPAVSRRRGLVLDRQHLGSVSLFSTDEVIKKPISMIF